MQQCIVSMHYKLQLYFHSRPRQDAQTMNIMLAFAGQLYSCYDHAALSYERSGIVMPIFMILLHEHFLQVTWTVGLGVGLTVNSTVSAPFPLASRRCCWLSNHAGA